MSDQVIPAIVDDITQHLVTNYLGVMSLTILVWDHVDTFPDEVEFVWKKSKSLNIYLFFINRYLTPILFVISLSGYFSPFWTRDLKTCIGFSRFQFGAAMVAVLVVGLMMFLRVRALYHGQKWIIGGLLLLWLIQFTTFTWLGTRSEPLLHNRLSGIPACTMTFDPEIGMAPSLFAWLPLFFDTLVLVLVLSRTIRSIRDRHVVYLMKRFLEDGLIYYSVIFAVTLLTALVVVFAPIGLKTSTGQVHILLSVAMMSRITINLQRSIHKAFGDQQYSSRDTSSLRIQDTRNSSPSPNGTIILDTLPAGLATDNEVEDEDPPFSWFTRSHQSNLRKREP